MSSEPIKMPSRRRLILTGTAALAIALAIAAMGIASRAHSAREVAAWTAREAIPTVALAQLQRGAPVQELTLPGTIDAFYRAPIYARVSGYLKSWQADIGAQVKAGDVLASIDTPDLDQQLEQAKGDLATASANAQVAAVTAGRWNTLVKSQWVSKQATDDKNAGAAATKATMEAASANVKRLEAMESFKNIVAPFDGVVTRRQTDVGALIDAGNAGQELFEVSDLHRVRIYVQVPQAFLGQLRSGLKATFEMPQYPGQRFDATVVTMSNALDVNSRSMRVELQADNPDGKLFAGAYCQVRFELPGDPNMMRVPATALIPVDDGVDLAVLDNDNKAVLKPVQLGRDFGDSVEVLAGLAPSDRVIDSPPETLESGDTVQLATTTASATQADAGPTQAELGSTDRSALP